MRKQFLKKPNKMQIIRTYCVENIKKYLEQTTLHGLKYLVDTSLTIWEKLFFLASFLAALIIVANLISRVYTGWITTPVIIGMRPRPISIVKIPFPALTICNMNQVLKSKVTNYTEDSPEFDLLRQLCLPTGEYNRLKNRKTIFENNLTVSDFSVKHAQPCAQMLLYCAISSIIYNCRELFHEVMTDEGLCCVFNTLHPDFLYKGKYHAINNLTSTKKVKAVNWNPEDGYPSQLPKNYYPRQISGMGTSMGVTLILNAQLDEYYCSSANGPGFKISLHNPITRPSVKETGVTVALGYETRFRIDATHSEAVPAVRSINRNKRQCIFINEENLLYYNNSTVCTVKDTFCVIEANIDWAAESPNTKDLNRCLPSCFDLSFHADSFSSPLAIGNYTIQNSLLQKMPKDEMRKNIALVHFYYSESIFYGNLKNIYIGFTEFLSNIGGILSLFMGFSLISLAEIVYFIILRPFFQFILPQKCKNVTLNAK